VNPPVSDQITKKSGSNLALALVLLPKDRRAAMTALYAYCRQVDDIADEDSVPLERRAEVLRQWREETRKACEGEEPALPVIQELKPYIERYRLPFRLFDELIAGVEMDLVTVRYADQAMLDEYCYRVASVVGLLSIEIFGYKDPACRHYADALGKALQMTNILRDVGNDAQRGRIYVPLADLQKFGVTEEEVLQGRNSDRFIALAGEIDRRARAYFEKARRTLPPVDRDAMISAELMGAVYWQLLLKLERASFPVLAPKPLRLSRARKIGMVLSALIRWKLGLGVTTYG
jgi:15-cis-phytoene synthase